MQTAHLAWGEEEFGSARLGNGRRTRRLVQVAAGVAGSPGGRITAVFHDGASREGAFRFVENAAVEPAKIASASHRACATRADGYSFVYVPVDGTSLNIKDWKRNKGLGVVGARFVGATGLQAMTAIAVAPNGTPLGVCGQKLWARRRRARPTDSKKDMRALKSKETSYWLDVMRDVTDVFGEHAETTIPWFQIDRGGDAWPVLAAAVDQGLLVTIRASHSRQLWSGSRLWAKVLTTPVRGEQSLHVPAGKNRTERTARMCIRFAEVTLDLHDPHGGNRRPAQFTAVLTREVRTTPQGEEPIEWLLLTTHPVEDLSDAQRVIDGYATRWTIEQFHRTWKSGACNVEETQLRATDHIVRWAVILAAVAMRIMRLSKLARTEPDLPATVELSQAEIDAAIVAKKTTNYAIGDVPTIGEVVTWIAELGGYTGRSSGGPPGPIVLTRGYERIQLLAEYLSQLRSEK